MDISEIAEAALIMDGGPPNSICKWEGVNNIQQPEEEELLVEWEE